MDDGAGHHSSKTTNANRRRVGLIRMDWLAKSLDLNPMADHQSAGQCLASPNPFVRINETGDKGGVGEIDGGVFSCMYREYP